MDKLPELLKKLQEDLDQLNKDVKHFEFRRRECGLDIAQKTLQLEQANSHFAYAVQKEETLIEKRDNLIKRIQLLQELNEKELQGENK